MGWSDVAFFAAVVLGLVVYPLLVYVGWRGLFHDGRAHLRRCPKCWHDLSGTPGMTCGECGYTARTEADLHRRRRRPGLALLGLVPAVVLPLYLADLLTVQGWATLVPTRLLITSLPLSVDQTATMNELRQRVRMDELTTGHWRALARRCASGDPWHEPGSPAWERTYGAIVQLGLPAMSGDDVAAGALWSIAPAFDLRVPEAWPADQPVRLAMNMRDWWPMDEPIRITVRPVLDGARPVVLRRASDRRFRSDCSITLPPIGDRPPDASDEAGRAVHRVPVELSVERLTAVPPDPDGSAGTGPTAARVAPTADETAWTPVWSGTQVVEVTIAGAGDALPTPDPRPAADELVRGSFDGLAVAWEDGRSPIRFRFQASRSSSPATAGLAVGVRLELRSEAGLARRLDLWWLADPPPGSDRRYGFEVVHEDLALLERVARDPTGWTLSVIGDQSIAMRAGEALHYWAGRLDLPVRLTEIDGAAPDPTWWVEGGPVDAAVERAEGSDAPATMRP